MVKFRQQFMQKGFPDFQKTFFNRMSRRGIGLL